MTRSIPPLAGLLLLCAASTLRAQSPTQSAHDLVKDVVYNELQERRQVSLWQYRVDKRVGNQTTIEQEVETVSGPVFRVLARQGKPLDAAQKKETDRLNNLLRNPAEQARMKQDHEAENRWKTTMLNVHISGRVVFFKSINRDQDVTRSAFKPLPPNTTVQDAITLLKAPLTP
jgi:hypothetical protein